MTSPPRSITVKCPKCGTRYQDWHRASMNLDLDDFDEEYGPRGEHRDLPELRSRR